MSTLHRCEEDEDLSRHDLPSPAQTISIQSDNVDSSNSRSTSADDTSENESNEAMNDEVAIIIIIFS